MNELDRSTDRHATAAVSCGKTARARWSPRGRFSKDQGAQQDTQIRQRQLTMQNSIQFGHVIYRVFLC